MVFDGYTDRDGVTLPVVADEQLARELAGTVTREMQVTALEITGEGNGWQINLDAEIRSPNGSRSQQLLLQFQERINRLSKLKQLEWESIHLSDSISPSASGFGVKDNEANLLTFSMRGMLRFSPLSHEESFN